MPREPTRIRPAIVVENHELFVDEDNILVVPLTRDERLARASLTVRIEPTPENGAEVTSWALAHHVSSVSRRRVKVTPSHITAGQLGAIRERIALALGIAE